MKSGLCWRAPVAAIVLTVLAIVGACTPPPPPPPPPTTTTTTTTTTLPLDTSVGGTYSVAFGTAGTVTVRQSGTGATAVRTIAVATPFRFEGATCSLSPGTVIATFTGAGPSYPETYFGFNATTCTHGGTYGGTVVWSNTGSLSIGTATGAHTLTKTSNATTVASPTPTGNYAININGSIGAVAVHQSGTGTAANYTASVTTPFKLEGATCSLTPGTVIATFTGAGPSHPEPYFGFNATTCTHGGTYGGTVRLNTDNSLTLNTYDGIALLTRTSNATTVASPTPTGNYAININGSIGAVAVHQSGTGTAANYTASVTTPFKLEGATCSLTPGTVIATFTGAGPSHPEPYFGFNATTCTHGGTYGGTVRLNTDNSLTLNTYDGIALLTRTSNATTVASPTPTGNYAININGSIGAVAVHQSGTGTAANYTASVTTPFKLEGATCSLTPGTVIATFTGAGPSHPEPYFGFNATTCTHGGTYGGTVRLNTDNSLTLNTYDGIALLTRTSNATTVASPTPTGNYAININGSIGAVGVSLISGAYRIVVTAPFRLEGATCSLAAGTVIATFTGAGPSYPEPYFGFNATTCVQGGTYGGTVRLNTDNSLTLNTYDGIVLITK